MTEDQKIFIELCKKSKKIIDVGSQHGEFINYANENMKNGEIYALEPDPNFIKESESIIPQNGNTITVKNTAAGSKKGREKFYNDKGTGCMSDIKTKVSQNFLTVDVDTLDNIFDFNVDLIKIDVESYEYEVLLGANRHMDSGAVFYIEIHDKWLKEIGKSKDDIIDLFEKKGYQKKFIWRNEKNWADLYYYIFYKK